MDEGERRELLGKRISELSLALRGTPVEKLVDQLYDELRAQAIGFLPPVYLSDEWGCPDSTPLIAVPFYLADERLMRIEEERAAGVETEADSMRYLRHEAGHAINYAYRLYDRPEWHKIFGPYSRPYRERYHADPFSRDHVRHILGWYAQKHPDEDFAETFAVWLTPGLDWRATYHGWPVLRKLEYVDALMREIGAEPPIVSSEVTPDDLPVDVMHYTVEEHYRELEQKLPIEDQRFFDGDLQTIFAADGDSGSAGDFIRTHRRELVGRIGYWSGEGSSIVGAFIDFLAHRVSELQLAVRGREASTLIELTAFGTAVMMNYRYTDTIGARSEDTL
ncbi:MAG: hypothetical protein WEE89_17420 [Gemmatimonadota bacterium]